MVASDNIALFVHTQAAVGITIVSKTNIQMIFHNKLLETLDVSGASIVIDVQAIRFVVNNISVRAKSIEHGLCDIPAGAIGTVQTDLDTLEGVYTQRDQVAHVAVTTGDVIHSTANMLTVGKGQLRPVLIKNMELRIHDGKLSKTQLHEMNL